VRLPREAQAPFRLASAAEKVGQERQRRQMKPVVLHQEIRPPLAMKPGCVRRRDVLSRIRNHKGAGGHLFDSCALLPTECSAAAPFSPSS
jgi:hypothetical protein